MATDSSTSDSSIVRKLTAFLPTDIPEVTSLFLSLFIGGGLAIAGTLLTLSPQFEPLQLAIVAGVISTICASGGLLFRQAVHTVLDVLADDTEADA